MRERSDLIGRLSIAIGLLVVLGACQQKIDPELAKRIEAERRTQAEAVQARQRAADAFGD